MGVVVVVVAGPYGAEPRTQMCHADGVVRGGIVKETGCSLDLEGCLRLIQSKRRGRRPRQGARLEQSLRMR